MRDYTPTAASIRSDYIRGTAADFIATEGKRRPCGSDHPVRSETARVALVWDREARAAAGPEFDRWFAGEIRKAKAEALREFADALAAVPDYAPSHYDQARVDQRHQTVMALLTYADKVEESA